MKFTTKIKAGLSVLSANIIPGYKKPLSIYMFLTYRCPFSCSYCNITKHPLTSSEIDTDTARRLIDEMADIGTIKLQFTGGEPMLREDIAELVSAAKKKNLFVGISTSGYKMEEKLDSLFETDIFFLSFEGREHTHDSIRGKGSYEVFRRARDILKQNGRQFWTTTVINRLNRDDIEYILETAETSGSMANFVMLHPREDDYLDCFRDKDTADKFYMSKEEYLNIIDKLISLKKGGAPIGTSLEYFEHIRSWGDYKKPYRNSEEDGKCWAGILYAYLEPDGTLYPCGTLRDQLKGIDAVELGFAEAFRQLEQPPCTSCLSGCQIEQNNLFSLKLSSIMNWNSRLR